MSTNSPLFDRIRVKPDQDRRLRADLPGCQWPGCSEPATHRAPKGRLRASEYWRFCLEHVREYNNSYNFFAGMSDDAVAKYQKDAITGHRPTWKMGSLGGKTQQRARAPISARPAGRARTRSACSARLPPPAAAMRGRQARAARSSMRSAARSTCSGLSRRQARRYQGQVQGAGETAPSRRQWRRPRLRRPPAGDHSAYNYLKSAGFC